MSDALHPTALRDMLDALSTQRTRKFCFMAEDELLNLYRRHGETGGKVTKVTFPPLAETLRDLISMVASRFGMKITVLPEGDQEKQAMVEYHRSPVIPTLMFADLIPKKCALFDSVGALGPLEGEGASKEADVSPAKKQKTEEQLPFQTNEASPQKASGSQRARPSQAVYRPRGAHQNESAAAGSVPTNPLSRPNEGEAAKETAMEISDPQQAADRMEDETEEGGCGLLHDYQPYRLDLTTTRAWDDQPRKRAYLDLGGTSSQGGGGGGGGGQNAGRTNWDGSWQLKRAGNGFVTFTVQAQSAEASTVIVTLKSEEEREQGTLVARIDPLSKRCSLARTLNGSELARAEGTAVTEARRGAVASPHARPPPESFWVAMRNGVTAVGSGSRVTSASAVAVLREETPLRAVRSVGFGSEGAPLSVSRIAIGKPLCPVLASVGHLATLHTQGALPAAVRAPPLPWCVRAAWRKMPSVATWGGGCADIQGATAASLHTTLAPLASAWPGVRVSATNADSGWAIFSSEADAARALQDGLASSSEEEGSARARAVSLGLCSSASREMLVAAGLPVARERRTTSTSSASRLISQALRQSTRPGSARPGR